VELNVFGMVRDEEGDGKEILRANTRRKLCDGNKLKIT
jgi:hypothetical protein